MRLHWKSKLRGQIHNGSFKIQASEKYPGLADKIILDYLNDYYLYGITIGAKFIGFITMKRGGLP